MFKLNYAELLQFSLKEDLINNGYPLIAEEVISKPQYSEEFIHNNPKPNVVFLKEI